MTIAVINRRRLNERRYHSAGSGSLDTLLELMERGLPILLSLCLFTSISVVSPHSELNGNSCFKVDKIS